MSQGLGETQSLENRVSAPLSAVITHPLQKITNRSHAHDAYPITEVISQTLSIRLKSMYYCNTFVV